MPAPNSGAAPRTTAFSGRYANLPVTEAAPNPESSPSDSAPVAAAAAGPAASAAGLPHVPTHAPGTQPGASGDDEENPYLADTPYYLSTLKGKAHEAKTEILVSALAFALYRISAEDCFSIIFGSKLYFPTPFTITILTP